MNNPKANIDKLLIQLNVLDSKIKRLEEITDEIVNDVELVYLKRIKDLTKKKKVAQQKLLKLQENDEK